MVTHAYLPCGFQCISMVFHRVNFGYKGCIFPKCRCPLHVNFPWLPFPCEYICIDNGYVFGNHIRVSLQIMCDAVNLC